MWEVPRDVSVLSLSIIFLPWGNIDQNFHEIVTYYIPIENFTLLHPDITNLNNKLTTAIKSVFHRQLLFYSDIFLKAVQQSIVQSLCLQQRKGFYHVLQTINTSKNRLSVQVARVTSLKQPSDHLLILSRFPGPFLV